MGIIGEATVNFYDKTSGKLIQSTSSKNMVTDAVPNILNGALTQLCKTLTANYGTREDLYGLFKLPDSYNIAKALFGGVLVFSSNIDENVNNIIPSTDAIRSFIGCANSGGSIAGNKFKGAFNASESKIGDDYVTFVWDFSSEQCNGEIACICLTSDVGGELGYAAITQDSSKQGVLNYLRSNMWSVNSPAEFNQSYPHNAILKTSFSTGNDHTLLEDNNNVYYSYRDTLYLYDIDNLSKKNGISILDDCGFGKTNSYTSTKKISPFSYSVFKTVDTSEAYQYDSNQSDSSMLTIYNISVADGSETVNTIKIPTTNIIESIYQYFNYTSSKRQIFTNSSYKRSIIHNSVLYFMIGDVNKSDQTSYPDKLRMYALNFDGTFKYKDIDCSGDLISTLFGTSTSGGSVTNAISLDYVRLFDGLYVESYSSTYGYKYYLLNLDTLDISEYPVFTSKKSLSYYGVYLYDNSNWLKLPWCSFKFVGSDCYNSVELWNPYLATINNQASGLRKTPSKTMKIIYTLRKA